MVRVHVVPGESGAGQLRRTIGDGEQIVVALPDALSCGPLRESASFDEWRRLRRSFWQQILGDQAEDFGDLRPHWDLFRRADSLTLWLGNGIGDQVTLFWWSWLARTAEIPYERLFVVQFPEDFVAHHRTPSLGMLSPPQIRKHPPAAPFAPGGLAPMLRVWTALSSPDPADLSSVLASSSPARATGALARLAWRYPHADSGLSFWERALLATAADRGPDVTLVLAHTLASPGWDVDQFGVDWLYWRLRRMAECQEPLVELRGNVKVYRETAVQLTRAGRSVLAGVTHMLDLNPIDDWVGGVHLDSGAGGTWVTSAGAELNGPPQPNCGLQLTWRSHRAAETWYVRRTGDGAVPDDRSAAGR